MRSFHPSFFGECKIRILFCTQIEANSHVIIPSLEGAQQAADRTPALKIHSNADERKFYDSQNPGLLVIEQSGED